MTNIKLYRGPIAKTMIWTALGINIIVLSLLAIKYAKPEVFLIIHQSQFVTQFLAKLPHALSDAITRGGVSILSEFCHGLTVVVLLLGVTQAYIEFRPDRRLNGTRYWVSEIVDDCSQRTRLAMGEITIKHIENYFLRAIEPDRVISGTILSVNGEELAQPGVFKSTDIVVGRRSSNKLMYEWEFLSDGANIKRGMTKLNIDYIENKSLFSYEKINNISGIFFADGADGLGTMRYYEDMELARRFYESKLFKQSKS